ncbi:MFS transporter [Actinokineospora soli]|uniref:MFS transporter n=1 Tax=Actinokineospora soli TaxID=1048753 RepID=A0ABW2TSL9_9PSEU
MVQGAAGAVLAPAGLSLLLAAFPGGGERTRALGVWAAVSAGGGALGLVLGGVLAHAGSWRWVFWLNLPLCATAFALACAVLTAPPADRVRFDVVGAVLATAGLVGLVFAASAGSPLWALAAVGLLTAFVLVERRTPRALLPPRLLRLRPVVGANAVALLLGTVIYAVFYFVSVFLADQRGYSTLEVGLAFLPMTATTVAGSRLAGTPAARARPPAVLAGALGVAALGFLPLTGVDAHSGYATTVLPTLALVGLGLGAAYVVLPAAAVDTAPARDRAWPRAFSRPRSSSAGPRAWSC